MSVSKVTGDPLVDKVIAQLSKQFSKQLVTLGPAIKQVPAVPTGSLALDLALGIGGIPRGRIIELYGPPGSSKTSMCLAMLARIQQADPDKYVAIVDMEYTITAPFLAGFGINPDKLLFIQCDTAEEAFQTTMDLTKSGSISGVVFDSIDACQREVTLNKELGASDVGGISKLASRFFREYSKVCPKTGTTALFINQIKANLGVMYGPTETTPGGSALIFYASLRLKASPIKPSKTVPNAYAAAFKITKNKLAPAPPDKIEFDFIYGRGPDPLIDTLNAAKDLGILVFAGPTLKLIAPDGSSRILSKTGAEGWITTARANPELINEVRDLCLATRENVLLLEEPSEVELPEETPPVPPEIQDA